MTHSLRLLLRIRKKIMFLVLLIFMAEIIFFVSACYVHRKLDEYNTRLEFSLSKLKELALTVQKQNNTQPICFENSKQAVAALKEIFFANNVNCNNISAMERENEIKFRLSGSSDYATFAVLLAELRKSRYTVKLNNFEMMFAGNGKLNYTLEVLVMRKPKEK